MAYRFTNTDKWNDGWFSKLKPIEKLLFIYLCDNCDIAGFIEINFKRWCADIDTDKKTMEGALKGLGRGLTYSKSKDCIFIRNYLKHQKNLPLNQNNQAHKGILNRFSLYSEKFEIQNIDEFIKGAAKGLESPSGNGSDILLDINKIDYEKLKEYWNEKTTFAKITIITKTRKQHLEARANEHGKDNIKKVFEKSWASSFLNGKNDKGWKADFDWILLPTNFIRILEGKFDDSYTNKPKNLWEIKNLFTE